MMFGPGWRGLRFSVPRRLPAWLMQTGRTNSCPWRTILMIGGAAVLVFNTASMGAMVKHYKEDKDFIYGLDIKHLDEMRGHKH